MTQPKLSIKNILVPTDFSDYADCAVNAAISVAKRFDAKIRLFHCISLPDIVIDQPMESENVNEFKLSIAKWAEAKLQVYEQKVSDANLSCSVEVIFGKFLEELEDIVKRNSIDLVVMGSQGATGKREWFIGSNTQKALRKLRLPIIVVKNQNKVLSLDSVLYVSGLDLDERPAFKLFLSFISQFEVKKLHILSVNKNVFFTQPDIVMEEALNDFKRIAAEFNTETHFYSDSSVDAGVRHFIKDNKIDFVGMSNNVRHPIKRLFTGSNVEIVANHSDVPLLVIDYQEN